MMEELLQRPQDPDLEVGGRTLLSYAASRGLIRVLHLLLEACADIDATDSTGGTPMVWACDCGKVEVVRLLLRAKADMDKPDAPQLALAWLKRLTL